MAHPDGLDFLVHKGDWKLAVGELDHVLSLWDAA